MGKRPGMDLHLLENSPNCISSTTSISLSLMLKRGRAGTCWMNWRISRLSQSSPRRLPPELWNGKTKLGSLSSTDVSYEPGRVFSSLAMMPPVLRGDVRTTFVLLLSPQLVWEAPEDYLLNTSGTERRRFLAGWPQKDLEDPWLQKTGLVHLVIFISPPTYSP